LAQIVNKKTAVTINPRNMVCYRHIIVNTCIKVITRVVLIIIITIHTIHIGIGYLFLENPFYHF